MMTEQELKRIVESYLAERGQTESFRDLAEYVLGRLAAEHTHTIPDGQFPFPTWTVRALHSCYNEIIFFYKLDTIEDNYLLEGFIISFSKENRLSVFDMTRLGRPEILTPVISDYSKEAILAVYPDFKSNYRDMDERVKKLFDNAPLEKRGILSAILSNELDRSFPILFDGKIPDYCYYNWDSLFKVPESAVRGGSQFGAFMYQMIIPSSRVNLPKSVTVIGQHAFDGCRRLTEIFIPNSVEKVESCAFANCPSLIIKCEADHQPSDWAYDWNPNHNRVEWGAGELYI